MPGAESTRIQQSILTRWEDPLLRRLARSMPGFVTSDGLTAMGLFGAILCGAGYVLARYHHGFFWLASFGLAVNWFGDSLDGHVARARAAERPLYGFYVDHVTDLFSQLFIGLGLALCGAVQPEAAGLALITYLVVVAATHMAQSVTGELRLSLYRLGPTEMRVLMVALNTLLFFHPPAPLVRWGVPLTAIDLAIFAISLWGLVALVFQAVQMARQIGLKDPPR
jgi:phosphatidylglycerophosphate synthase